MSFEARYLFALLFALSAAVGCGDDTVPTTTTDEDAAVDLGLDTGETEDADEDLATDSTDEDVEPDSSPDQGLQRPGLPRLHWP